MKNIDRDSSIILWLNTISIMVFAMVFIGGITRLTDSGLSIVDWKPLVGAIPPLSEVEWLHAFEKYKAFPEFKLMKSDMDLDGFKAIYFWEYFHRLFGRLIGVVFLFPYIYFRFKKCISKNLNKKLIFAFLLGGAQGLMGWYMVKSGLVSKPDVSHYRLAAHLSLAFLIIGYIHWTVLSIRNPLRKFSQIKPAGKLLIFFCVLVILQIIYGAFVAGLDAGLTHNTFPKMGRDWIPGEFVGLRSDFLGVFENVVIVQFIHRSIAWLLLIVGFTLFRKSLKLDDFMQKKAIKLLLGMLLVQFVIGVMTILYVVPITLASLHQIGACILVLLMVRALFYSFTESNH
ncbi:MAG: cytochrome c oxidase assembly protein subunit 15 [Bacteriovoracaceae bacterium]|jgi:cytochrome c oxidase assembly protein subunit 15